MALWLILAAVATALSPPSGAQSPDAAPASAALPASSTVELSPADGIPLALQKVTECMVDTAKATRGVLSAERAVSFQDGKAYVDVTYKYRTDDGRVGIADYNRLRDATPLENWEGTHVEKPFVLFGTILPGAFPMCDRERGRPNCENVRAWDRSRPQPIPGWGIDAVRSAWEQTCGVATVSFTA
jgi:hypothetical protein